MKREFRKGNYSEGKRKGAGRKGRAKSSLFIRATIIQGKMAELEHPIDRKKS